VTCSDLVLSQHTARIKYNLSRARPMAFPLHTSPHWQPNNNTESKIKNLHEAHLRGRFRAHDTIFTSRHALFQENLGNHPSGWSTSFKAWPYSGCEQQILDHTLGNVILEAACWVNSSSPSPLKRNTEKARLAHPLGVVAWLNEWASFFDILPQGTSFESMQTRMSHSINPIWPLPFP